MSGCTPSVVRLALLAVAVPAFLVTGCSSSSPPPTEPPPSSIEGPAPSGEAPAPSGEVASDEVPGGMPGDEVPDGMTDEEIAAADARDEAERVHDEHMDKSRRAMQRDDLEAGLKECEAALAAKPDSVRAATICGVAACRLRRTKKIAKFRDMLKQMNSQRLTIIRQMCLKSGVTDFDSLP